MEKPNITCSISEETIPEVERTFAPSTESGADIRFHGVVRDREDGREISGIEYSFYEGMALQELEKICSAISDTHPDHLVQIHHRIGFVPIGEASIIIRLQTAHSALAFELCAEYLRQIKKTVPIWKQPIFVS